MSRLAHRDQDDARYVDVDGTFAVREAEAGDGRTIEGIAVPYGEAVRGNTREYGTAAETFEAGAFRDVIASVERGERVPIIDRHDGDVVGYADRLWESPEGLRYSGRLLSIDAARDFATRIAERVMRVSVEFMPGEVRRAANAVTHTRVRMLGAIAGSYRPAYAGATASIRDIGGQGNMEHCRHCGAELVANVACQCAGAMAQRDAETRNTPPTPDPVRISQGDIAVVAQRITDEAIRTYAASQAFGGSGHDDPFVAFRGLTFGELAERAVADGAAREDREWMRWAIRTFADTVTTSSANAGMVTPGVVGDVAGIVSRGRPAITAFGGPRQVPNVSGMSIDWPYFDGTLSSLVGAQSSEKAEITSAAVNIKKGTEALATYAGGSDISYQLLRRSTRNYLDVYYRILLTAWGVVTDAAFVTELESGSVTSDMAEALSGVDATEFKNLVVDASIAVQTATGLPAEFVLASTTAFTQFAKLFTPITTLTNSGFGTLDLRSLTVNVGGLPVIHVPSITAGKLIVSNREAAAWYEDGPFQVQDEDVIHLGKNTAIWSMGAGARFIPAGIIEMYDVTP